jgi:hypothetical protein
MRRMLTRWTHARAADAREHALRELSRSRRVRVHRRQPATLCRSVQPARQDRSVLGCEGVQRMARTDLPVPAGPQNPSRETPGCDEHPRLAVGLSNRLLAQAQDRARARRRHHAAGALPRHAAITHYRRVSSGARSQGQLPLANRFRCEPQGFGDVLCFQIRIELQNLRGVPAVGHHVDDHGYRDAEATNARGSAHLIGADRNAGESWRSHSQSLPDSRRPRLRTAHPGTDGVRGRRARSSEYRVLHRAHGEAVAQDLQSGRRAPRASESASTGAATTHPKRDRRSGTRGLNRALVPIYQSLMCHHSSLTAVSIAGPADLSTCCSKPQEYVIVSWGSGPIEAWAFAQPCWPSAPSLPTPSNREAFGNQRQHAETFICTTRRQAGAQAERSSG